MDESKAHGVTVYQPDAAFFNSIDSFAKDNLLNVYKTARYKHKIENPESLITQCDDTVEKWRKLFSDVDRKDANAIAAIIKCELLIKMMSLLME